MSQTSRDPYLKPCDRCGALMAPAEANDSYNAEYARFGRRYSCDCGHSRFGGPPFSEWPISAQSSWRNYAARAAAQGLTPLSCPNCHEPKLHAVSPYEFPVSNRLEFHCKAEGCRASTFGGPVSLAGTARDRVHKLVLALVIVAAAVLVGTLVQRILNVDSALPAISPPPTTILSSSATAEVQPPQSPPEVLANSDVVAYIYPKKLIADAGLGEPSNPTHALERVLGVAPDLSDPQRPSVRLPPERLLSSHVVLVKLKEAPAEWGSASQTKYVVFSDWDSFSAYTGSYSLPPGSEVYVFDDMERQFVDGDKEFLLLRGYVSSLGDLTRAAALRLGQWPLLRRAVVVARGSMSPPAPDSDAERETRSRLAALCRDAVVACRAQYAGFDGPDLPPAKATATVEP